MKQTTQYTLSGRLHTTLCNDIRKPHSIGRSNPIDHVCFIVPPLDAIKMNYAHKKAWQESID